MTRPGAVCVVGSLNVDRYIGLARLPQPGETLLGESLGTFPGGKGLNQAVAAARCGELVFAQAAAPIDRAGDVDIEGGVDPLYRNFAVGFELFLALGLASDKRLDLVGFPCLELALQVVESIAIGTSQGAGSRVAMESSNSRTPRTVVAAVKRTG